MIPEEMKRLRQWIMLPPGQKYTNEPGWQNNPRLWDDIKEPNGRGFLLAGTPYICIDGDHVLKDGEYVNQWAKDFFGKLIDTGTYGELSISGTGVHVFFKMVDGLEGCLGKLTKANGNPYNYELPGFDHLTKNERPHIEIFYNAVRQICLTGMSFDGNTVEPAPVFLNELLEKMPPFIAPVVRKTELPQEYDLQRAAAMLNHIDPAALDYAEWIKVGAVLHDLGADISLWDEWSRKDSARYKGFREIESKWRSFKKGTGATIAGLHALAKAGGYVEKEFARDWYKEHTDKSILPVERTARNLWGNGVQGLLQRIQEGKYIPEPTGIPVLDGFFYGGLARGQLVLLGAAPGMGKTATLQWLVESMADRNKDFSCMYFCFEMSSDQLQARGLSRWLFEMGEDVPAMCIMKGDKFEAVKKAAGRYESIIGRVAYNPGVGGNALARPKLDSLIAVMEEGARYKVARGEKVPICVVDYVQLVNAGGRDERENIEFTMTALKTFAVNWNTVVLAAMATNRQANKAGDSSMFAGRGSSALEYGCDILLTIGFTDILDGGDSVNDAAARSLVVSKGRGYENNSRLDFKFDGRHSSLCDLHVAFGHAVGKSKEKRIRELLS